MATPNADDLKKVKDLLSQIEKAYSKLGKSNPFTDTPEKIALSAKEIQKLEDALDGVNSKIYDLEEGFGGIASTISASLAEMDKQNSSLNRTIKAMRGIKSITQDLANDQSGLSELSLKELKSRQDKLKILSLEAKQQAEATRLQYEGFNLDKNGNELNSAQLPLRLKKLGITKSEAEKIKEIIAADKEGLTILDKAIDRTNKRVKEEEKINKQLGVAGALLKGISKIPILGDAFDSNEALEKMRENIKQTNSPISALGAGFKNIGKQIKDGVLNPSNLILAAFTILIKTLKDVDSTTGEFAKAMNMTYSESLAIRGEMVGIASASGNAAISSKLLLETYKAVGVALGTNSQLNEKDLITMTALTHQAGLQYDELMNIEKISLINNKSLEDNTKEILGATAIYNVKNKLALNEKQILKDVNNMSTSLKLSLGGGAEQMTIAASKAREFGINLQQSEAIAQSLLNFESSIENELSAELITGQALNLERARGLALSGKTADASAEILKQVGSAANFGNMNVIQQESIAKAMGMQREELANSLVDKEALNKMGVKGAETTFEAYKALKEQNLSEMDIAERLGDKKMSDMLEQQSIQERFNDSVQKLQEIFVSIAEPVLAILNPIINLVTWVSKFDRIIKSVLVSFVAIKTAMMITTAFQERSLVLRAKDLIIAGQIKLMEIQTAVAKMTGSGATSFGLTAAIGLAAGAAAYAYLGSIKDGVIDPKKGPVMSGEFGSVQLDPNDKAMYGADGKIKVGTNLNPKQGGGSDLTPLISEIRALRAEINKRPIHTSVQIDGKQVAAATANNSQTFYDSSAPNNFKVQ